MRVGAIAIRNFRGIRRVELDGLANEPLITLSGRNGSGKSLVLEAMGVLWRADRLPPGLQPQFLLGSWGDEVYVEMEIHLSPEERAALQLDGPRLMGVLDGEAPEVATICLRLSTR